MNHTRAKHRLRELEVKPRKERGQNFVIDPSVIDAIVGFGAPAADDDVVEIGPGLGALTERLVVGRSLTLIEIEKRFCGELAGKFPNATIVNEDVRKVSLSDLGSGLVVFGNLPYVFSTDIIFHLVEHHRAVSRAVLLLQREFAERVAAPPGGRDYGVLSVMARAHCDASLGPIIPGTAFHPPAKVESRVLGLKFLKEPRVPEEELPWFRKVVKAAFHMRRKKIHNSLKSSGLCPAGASDRALSELGLDPGRRAETFSLEELAALARELRNIPS